MKKNIPNLLMLCAAMLALVIVGCGKVDTLSQPAASSASKSTVFGVASLDETAGGTVSIKDSSLPAQELTTAIGGNGDYTADVSGLKKPYILRAEGTDKTGEKQTLYSVSKNGGRTNINPLSDAAVAALSDTYDKHELYNRRSGDDDRNRSADRFEAVIMSLRTVLAPLFALYQTSGNVVSNDDDDDGDDDGDNDGDDDDSDNSGLRAMLRDVRFDVTRRTVTVTNRLTGGIIFTGLLNDLESGTFTPENMPGGTGGTTACTYTYDAWGACQSNNTQARSLLTSTPSGCAGTPVLSQACTYVPPVPTACTYNYSGWGACQTNNTQTRTVLQATPAGCTGTPVLSQACTYVPPAPTACAYTYSAWGACQSNNTQTRTMLTSSPAGCAGTPLVSQACTYVPPAPLDGAALYATYCGGCHGALASSTKKGRTAAQIQSAITNNAGGMGFLSTLTTEQNQAIAAALFVTTPPPAPACGSCHAIPPASGEHSFHRTRATCATCHGTGYSTTAVNTATHQNGVINIASTPGWNPSSRSCSNSCHGSKSW